MAMAIYGLIERIYSKSTNMGSQSKIKNDLRSAENQFKENGKPKMLKYFVVLGGVSNKNQ